MMTGNQQTVSLLECLVSPWKKDKLVIFLSCVVLLFIGNFLSIVGIFVEILAVAYLFSVMKKIIVRTGESPESELGIGDISECAGETAENFFQFIGVVICFFWPLILLGWMIRMGNTQWVIPIIVAGVITSWFAPMGLFLVSLYDSLNGLNPILVFSMVGQTIGVYAKVGTLFVVLVAGGVALVLCAYKCISIGYLQALCQDIISVYLLLASSRLVGLFYFRVKDLVE